MMKIKTLKLDKACDENWEHMSPKNDGRFCHLCSKTVIDFTQLSPEEISKKLKSAKGNVCAKLTKTQLNTPLIHIEESKTYSLPYSKVAAGVMLAASLTSIQSCKEQSNSQNTELVSIHPSETSSKIQQVAKVNSNSKDKFTTLFKGHIFSEDSLPLHNAKVTFVTVNQLFTTHTNADGSFILKVPNSSIDNDNVVRLSYYDIVQSKESKQRMDFYEEDDLVLSKEELKNSLKFYAKADGMMLGGIGQYSYEAEYNPLIIVDGKQVAFKEFEKSRFGKKSSCNIENKGYLHFGPEAAMALCGDKAKFGLYLFFNKDAM